ncbi:MAG: tRNA pseudouridine(38-40) synthase TruA [Acidimicrobiales bacterium]
MSLFDQESADIGPPAPVEQEAPPPVEGAPEPRRSAAEPGLSSRVRLTVAYDGSRFRGFAPNLGVRTVAGELAGALGRVLGHDVTLTCAGRTDAGVHAWGQVVHFDTTAEPDLVALLRSLNKMLGPAVVVRDGAVAPHHFDARHSAVGRRYRYTVLNRTLPDPFLAATTWHVDDPLDLGSMTLACDPLIGEHDWSSFCKRPPGPDPERGPRSMVRVVREAQWTDLGDGVLRFEIEASAFCHQMVRSLVGTLVAVGRGRMRAGDIGTLIRARDRSEASEPAPPHGLCLWEVKYPEAS